MKKVLILVNGEYGDYHFCRHAEEYDMIICADNGMHHARSLGLIPDLIVGDFDSSSPEDLRFFRNQKVRIETFDPHKDATDTELAVERAVEAGAGSITIWGGVGTRLDHSLGNVQILYKLLKLGIEGELINPYNKVMLVNGKKVLDGRRGQLVSLLPFMGEVRGVTTENLEYPLNNAALSFGNSLGVSNVMLADRAQVSVQDGVLLVIMASD